MMQSRCRWVRSTLIRSTLLSATTAFPLVGLPFLMPTQLQAQETASTLVGQCRAAKQQTTIFQERSASSKALTIVKVNEKVTLAENTASEGMISVSAPVKGFIQTVNLKPCPGQPKPDTSVCRMVTQTKGLVIRKEPGTGEVVGGVKLNEKVTLAGTTSKTIEGRIWVEVSKPMAGWISSGLENGSKNLDSCK
ncbi:MAG: SH3 domain-containing protein [Synechococcales bacterium]|nr:SH3 domain-containing protein [Synechococcales bacterium]